MRIDLNSWIFVSGLKSRVVFCVEQFELVGFILNDTAFDCEKGFFPQLQTEIEGLKYFGWYVEGCRILKMDVSKDVSSYYFISKVTIQEMLSIVYGEYMYSYLLGKSFQIKALVNSKVKSPFEKCC